MKTTVSINELIVCLILTAVLGEFHFWGLWTADGIYKKLVMITAVLSAAVLCLRNNQANRMVFHKYKSAVRYMISILIFAFFVQFYYFALFSTGVSIYEYLADSGRFTYFIALIPLVYIFENEKLNRMFWNGFQMIAFVQILIGEISDFILHYFGINVLNSATSWRGGRLGILIVVPLVYLPMIKALSDLLNKRTKNSVFHVIFLALGIHFGVFISKNRSGFLAFFAAAAVMILTGRADRRNKILRNWLLTAAGTGVAAYAFFAGYVHALFSISGGEFASSNNAHIAAVLECWNYFKEHPLLGAGFRLHWPVSYCDAGFTGLLANIGIFGFFLFFIPELKAVIRVIRVSVRKKDSAEIAAFKGFTVFAFFTAFTFILTDESRMMGWIIIYSYMSYMFANQPEPFKSENDGGMQWEKKYIL